MQLKIPIPRETPSMKLFLRLLLVFALMGAVSLLSGCYYLESEPVPDVSNYDLDLAELRRLARSDEGELPSEIRLEMIGTATLPGAMMMAGRSWDPIEMTHVVFQVVWPNGNSLLIDGAQDRELHESMPGSSTFDDTAWTKIVAAMEAAEQIVITHEHADHLAGVTRHPRLKELISKLRLTEEQLANQDALDAIDFPEELLEQISPVAYDDAVAIAPGVVLKKAPGHSPGSQMVYVALEDGRELLFVGDVIWNLDAITDLLYRPRLITGLIGENRESAIHQLRALRDLHDQGDVVIVVSHDRRTHASASITKGFSLSLPSADVGH